MTRIGWVNVAAGAFVLGVSAAFFLMAFQYEMGTLSRMGAGLFPVILGGTGIIVGAALLINGIFNGDTRETFDPVPARALVCTLLAIAGFAMFIREWGLLPAVFVSTGVSALGDRRNSVFDVIGLAIAAAALVWVVFVWALGLPMPLLRGVL